MPKRQVLPLTPLALISTAIFIAALMVLNAWVTFNNMGPQQQPFGWAFEITNNLIIWLLWAALLPLISILFKRIVDLDRPQVVRLLIALALSLLIACIHRYGTVVIYIVFTKLTAGFWLNAFGEHSIAWVLRGTIPSWIQLILMQVMIMAINNYREKQQQTLKLSKLNEQLSDAELNALKMQLHPHFFFNTLNSISSLMDIDIDKAQHVVAKLGQLMRTMLDSAKRQFIPLKTEIDYINDYLVIEGARFSDRLDAHFDISEDSLNAKIPNLLLQPLVENSIKHGIGGTSDEVKITISSRVENQQLILAVQDNGRGVSNIDYILQHPGIGIKSLQTRLHHLYCGNASVNIESAYRQGFKVIITIPYQVWDLSNGH
ncbi:MAG: histidine kinase [Algicola sp.]|nr:histidine kinase [Algicola sp.]